MSKFEDALQTLKEEYEREVKYRESLSEKLKEWNKDAEIQRLENMINKGYLIPESVLNKMVESAINHGKETRHNNWSYVITQTYLDDCVECRCNTCNEVLYRGWN